MKKIVERVGNIICLDPKTESGSSMGSAKSLVRANFMPFMEDHLYLSVGDINLEIYLKELDRDVEKNLRKIE